MRLLLSMIAIVLLSGCGKEVMQPTYCFECQYHEQTWQFCDMTENRMDSIRGIFNRDGCDQDTLICLKLNGEN